MKTIVNVGSFIIDLAVFATRLPVAGETVLGDRFKLGAGGKGSNQATAAHRSGGNVKMIGKVGTDSLARIIADHYAQEGMAQDYISVSQSAPTGVAAIEIDTATGQNRIIVVKGANDALSSVDVAAAAADFAACDVVRTQLETSMESVLECKRQAHQHGKTFILNPAPFQPVPDGLFAGVDYLTPNETEAAYYAGVEVTDEASAREAAGRLLTMGVHNVVLTLGERGVYFSDGRQELAVPPPQVTPVDTTGAGDALNGGLAVALAEGMPIQTALRFANCVAALSVTRAGSSPSMPARAESERLLEEFYGVRL